MPISMYQASVPLFRTMLGSLAAILEKGAAFCEAKKIDPLVLVNARLAPDMFPLSRQVQIATDIARGCVARLSGQEVPAWENTETTFAELDARIKRALAYLEAFTPAQIDGSEERDIEMKSGGNVLKFKGQRYLVGFVIPNVLFHVTTAYDILRHNGVEIGKRDFLGSY